MTTWNSRKLDEKFFGNICEVLCFIGVRRSGGVKNIIIFKVYEPIKSNFCYYMNELLFTLFFVYFLEIN